MTYDKAERLINEGFLNLYTIRRYTSRVNLGTRSRKYIHNLLNEKDLVAFDKYLDMLIPIVEDVRKKIMQQNIRAIFKLKHYIFLKYFGKTIQNLDPNIKDVSPKTKERVIKQLDYILELLRSE